MTPIIHGRCPGAHQPMGSGDGLVVRVRPPLGELTPAQALGLADLAEKYASGIIELTSRANLQLRGVAAAGHVSLISALSGLGLIDADPKAEARRNIVTDPFRGLGTNDPQQRIAAGLTQGLQSSDFAALPGKFGFVVDAGPQRQLAGISGDLRIEGAGAGLIVRADGAPWGRLVADADAAVRLALEQARWFIQSGGVGADGRGRMARHLANGAQLPAHLTGTEPPNDTAPAPRVGAHPGGLSLAAAFGQMAAPDLRALAGLGAKVLRVTPWRMIWLPGVAQGAAGGLIHNPADPLLRVWACTGAPGCPQAYRETRDFARGLAGWLPPDVRLHVSGCAKGCAHPGPADLTLVGGPQGFDLIRNKAPWDPPDHRAISVAQMQDLLGG